MTLTEYLDRKSIGGFYTLTFVEAVHIGIKYPLRKGWQKLYAERIVPKAGAMKVVAKLQEKAAQVSLNEGRRFRKAAQVLTDYVENTPDPDCGLADQPLLLADPAIPTLKPWRYGDPSRIPGIVHDTGWR